MSRCFVIAAGGTGGHVFPALAVAEMLRRAGVHLLWIGTRSGIESRLVPARGIELVALDVGGVRGKGAWRGIGFALGLLRAVLRTLSLFARNRPAAVLGMGGYAAGPTGVAAWLLRVPLLVHEQNAIAGYTNRVLGPLATRVLQAFPGTFAAARDALTVGNPVRAELTGIDPPESRSAFREPRLRILVLGGSQGARFLNDELPAVFARLDRDAIEIWHQCGAADHARTVDRYRGCGVRARADAFLDDMRAAFDWAQLAICRGGALTVAELAAVGLGAIIVPFPHAVDDHQARNAAFLVEHRAAMLVRQDSGAAAQIESTLNHLLGARAEVLAMACRARALAQPDAAQRVAELCLEFVHA